MAASVGVTVRVNDSGGVGLTGLGLGHTYFKVTKGIGRKWKRGLGLGRIIVLMGLGYVKEREG